MSEIEASFWIDLLELVKYGIGVLDAAGVVIVGVLIHAFWKDTINIQGIDPGKYQKLIPEIVKYKQKQFPKLALIFCLTFIASVILVVIAGWIETA